MSLLEGLLKSVSILPLSTKGPQWGLPEAFSSLGEQLFEQPHLSQPFLIGKRPYSGPAPICPCLPCTKDPRAGQSTKSGGASWERSRGGKPPPLISWPSMFLTNVQPLIHLHPTPWQGWSWSVHPPACVGGMQQIRPTQMQHLALNFMRFICAHRCDVEAPYSGSRSEERTQ